MKQNTFFCSDASRARAECFHGTVPFVESWLLIEYPGPWLPRGIIDSALPLSVKAKIKAMPLGHRALLIRQGHSNKSRLRCFVVHSREHSSAIWEFRIEDYEELLNVDVQVPSEQCRVDQSLYLVCTDGRHDKCCSKYGLPAFRTIQERMGPSAWQCSHVGGDRFAANVLIFPFGLYYGQVCPSDVDPLLDSSLRRQIYLKNLRGRSCYQRPAQVGEYFVRRESGLIGLDQLKLIGVETIGSTHWRTHFSESASIFTAEFLCAESPFREFLTCAATTAKASTKYELLNYSEKR
jgi:hypothetical protein